MKKPGEGRPGTRPEETGFLLEGQKPGNSDPAVDVNQGQRTGGSVDRAFWTLTFSGPGGTRLPAAMRNADTAGTGDTAATEQQPLNRRH